MVMVALMGGKGGGKIRRKEIENFWGIRCQATKIKINTTANGVAFTALYKQS